MSVAQQQPAPTSEPGSDRAVVEAVRAGEISQFALLYERYSREAMGIARRQVGADEAQDLVQETFAKVLRAIQNGGGPTEDVAGYIFRTLRNLRIDRGGQREFATDDVESAGPAGLWVVPDTSDEVLDRGLVSDAFAELPPRWREVLWLTEVEGVGPGELSDRMGIKATAVSTLSLRARAGFRSAWLQAHVRAGSAPSGCRPVVTRLGDYQTGRLSSRRRAQVESHLDECDHCPAVVAELAAVSGHMGALLLPVVVLAPKALWWVFGGWGVKAGFLLWGTKATLNRLRDPKVAAGSVGGAATVAVVTAVAMAMTAPPEPPPAAGPAPSASAPAPNSSGQSSSSSGSSTGDDQAEPDDAEEPADQPEPADSPASVPAAPVDPGPEPVDPAPVQQDSPAPAEEPVDEPTQASEPDDPAPEPEEPTDEPTDPAPEPEEPETTAPDAPIVTDAPAGQTTMVYGGTLELTGTDAVPGARITATDADGDPVAEGQVDDDGNWTLEIGNPGSGGEPGGGMPGLASGGTASRSVTARGLADVAAERGDEDDDDRGDGGDDDEGDEGAGDDDAGDGVAEDGEGTTDGGHYFTLTQTVPDGASDEYAGASEPVTVGPFSWVAPLAVLSPEDGGEAEVTQSGGGWADYIWVEYQHDCRFDVQFFLNGSPVELHDLVPIDVCDPTSGLLTGRDHLHGVTSRSYELAMQYVDDDGELVGNPATVCFTAVSTRDAGEDDGDGDDSGDDRDCPEPDSEPTGS
ncbi:sigma-70 family RNA polymerase sigma factor [Ruania zhangjianzhongii]|uniref:sigma-70 family RNA polymerase sigma factor n=1 Tax=Ruania zhangjianzhongii TaxID=2603206 RepID=UPI0011CCBD3C|nr:sigma-70 family RNA polymerase sigma factor [Ruania zhangjianzhongii]